MTDYQLKKHRNGFYRVHWVEKIGDAYRSKRVSTRTKDPTLAAQFMAQFVAASRRAGSDALVATVLADYMSEHGAGCDAATRQADIVKILTAEFGALRPGDLSADCVSRYCTRRRRGQTNGRQVGDGTLRRELNVLIAALNHAVNQRRLTAAEIPHIKLPEPPQARDIWLTEVEAQQLLIAVAKWDRKRLSRIHRFIAIALATASRKRAILNLKWSQVDFVARLIHFQSGEDGAGAIKRRVAVPISDDLLVILQQAHKEREADYVLDHSGEIRHTFDDVCSEAATVTGNEKFHKVTPHTLRHTWATLAARAGVAPYQIAGVLGDSLTTVVKNYLHHCPGHLVSAVNAIRLSA